MKALIGVDIGTQGTKAALFAEDGACLASAFRKSALHQPRAGVVEEDPERQVATVCQTIKECVVKARVAPSDLAAVAIDGQMAGIIGVDEQGRCVTPYDSWLDTRCAPYITRMNAVARAMIEMENGKHDSALKIVTDAIAKIEGFEGIDNPTYKFERERSLTALQGIAVQIEQTRPVSELDQLKQQLHKAVDTQEFESAAELRDKIRELKKKDARA